MNNTSLFDNIIYYFGVVSFILFLTGILIAFMSYWNSNKEINESEDTEYIEYTEYKE